MIDRTAQRDFQTVICKLLAEAYRLDILDRPQWWVFFGEVALWSLNGENFRRA